MALCEFYPSFCEKYEKRGNGQGQLPNRMIFKYKHRLGLVMPASFLPGPEGEKIGEPPPVRSDLALPGQGLIRSCSQKPLNIHVILNEAQWREESRRLKKRDSSLHSE